MTKSVIVMKSKSNRPESIALAIGVFEEMAKTI